MKMQDITGKTAIIHRASITVEEPYGKTQGIVRGVQTRQNTQANKLLDMTAPLKGIQKDLTPIDWHYLVYVDKQWYYLENDFHWEILAQADARKEESKQHQKKIALLKSAGVEIIHAKRVFDSRGF